MVPKPPPPPDDDDALKVKLNWKTTNAGLSEESFLRATRSKQWLVPVPDCLLIQSSLFGFSASCTKSFIVSCMLISYTLTVTHSSCNLYVVGTIGTDRSPLYFTSVGAVASHTHFKKHSHPGISEGHIWH